ncbi:rCG30457 [Rattus norvegicus]|uniref:RCG30457 n=1 Tax=Rattus norvegicus TaxID=10116 RepID=A6JFC5_RAT|nr:rCG30457 [Rattus norvegicus]
MPEALGSSLSPENTSKKNEDKFMVH